MAVEVKNHFGDLADALPDILSKVVRTIALDAQAHIQRHIHANGQVDTGNMLNSVYTVTDEGGSTYPGGGTHDLLPAIDEQPDKTTAYVAVAAAYGAPQNYGTRHLPARPFFEPGIEDARPGFEAALAAIEGQLKRFEV